MSRIGKLPIQIPAGVDVKMDKSTITVKGKLGELKQDIDPNIGIEIKDNTVFVSRSTEQKAHKSLHGLTRSLISSMVQGVSEGYSVKLEFVGVGYKVTTQGQLLDMHLGFSHNILMEVPKEIKMEAETQKRANPILTLTSADKQLLGHLVAKLRSFRPPEPYKGKGIKFIGEELRRKQGKLAAK